MRDLQVGDPRHGRFMNKSFGKGRAGGNAAGLRGGLNVWPGRSERRFVGDVGGIRLVVENPVGRLGWRGVPGGGNGGGRAAAFAGLLDFPCGEVHEVSTVGFTAADGEQTAVDMRRFFFR